MGASHFSGPVYSTNGFVGDITGNITGNVTGNVTGVLTGRVVDTQGARSGPGAIDITTGTTLLTTTGANDALTLANGTAGQRKTVIMVVDGGDGILTPTTKTGFTTVTFTAVGNSVTLEYVTTLGWMVVANFGSTVA